MMRKIFLTVFALVMTTTLSLSISKAERLRGGSRTMSRRYNNNPHRGEKASVTTLLYLLMFLTRKNTVLPKSPHHSYENHRNSSYLGCLGYTTEELEKYWGFTSRPVSCSYTRPVDVGGGNVDSSGDEITTGNDDVRQNDGEGCGDQSCVSEDGNNNKVEYTDSGTLYYEVVVTNENLTDGADYDVYEDFDISQCGTYMNLWIWDLAMTCTSKRSFDNCNCTFAGLLVFDGLLDCDDVTSCPVDCPICATCLSLIGCNVTDVPDLGLSDDESSSSDQRIIYIVTIILVTILILSLLLLYRAQNVSKGASDDLKKRLIVQQEATHKNAVDGNPLTMSTVESVAIEFNLNRYETSTCDFPSSPGKESPSLDVEEKYKYGESTVDDHTIPSVTVIKS